MAELKRRIRNFFELGLEIHAISVVERLVVEKHDDLAASLFLQEADEPINGERKI